MVIMILCALLLIYLIFAFIDCLVIDEQCEHTSIATYESRGFRQCIDCLEKFSLKGK